jgi:para-aminobenzoate synthetase component I
MTAEFKPLVEPLAGTLKPADACQRFADLPYVLFLDSAAADHPDAHYSFLTADPACVVRSKGNVTEIWRHAGQWTPAQGDALTVARALLPAQPIEPIDGLPPFQGGIAGYIGYDWGAVLEQLPRPRFDDLGIPDVVLCLYDWVIAWDHRSRQAWLISTGLPEVGQRRKRLAGERMDLLRRRLSGQEHGGTSTQRVPDRGPSLLRDYNRGSPGFPPMFPVSGIESAGRLDLQSTFTRQGYLEAVTRVREYILAGDIFQANLSQRFQGTWESTPLDLYHRLRRRNPAPFAAYLGFNDVAVLSASPERFLRLDGGHIETRPIKGTRPRGLGPMHDAALGRALAESRKDRAENVMIVDLLRNDLSRVCRPGTVRVPELFALEHHPTVHHLV